MNASFSALEVQVSRVESMGDGTFLLGVRCAELTERTGPGQFYMIRGWDFPPPLWNKPFSICQIQGDELLFLMRTFGRGTASLKRKKPGDSVSVIGPLGGSPDLDRSSGSFLLVAGGIGLAPFPLLARELRARNPGARITLVYGERTGSLVIDTGGLFDPGVEIILTTDDGTVGRKSTTVDAMAPELEKMNEPTVIACGPRPMLKALQVHPACAETDLIFFMEELMACGYGTCMGCVIALKDGKDTFYARVCREGPAFDGKRVVL